MRSRLRGVVAGFVTLLAIGLGAPVQEAEAQAVNTGSARVEATRAELEAVAAHPPKGMSAGDLRAVQNRLAKGDFGPGDRITIGVQGEADLSNTFMVGAGTVLTLPGLPPLPLSGVLRSESDSVITEFIGRFIRDPQVTVQPLLRLGVLGGVGAPGYYEFPSTTLLSEVVMAAGGMSPTGKMSKSQVYRNNDEILNPKAVNEAISSGMTLDLLNIQSGDNFHVGEKQPGFMSTIGIVTAVLAIPLMIVTITSLKSN